MSETNPTREELQAKRIALHNKGIEVSKQIEALDYGEKLKKTSEYIGRCFIEISQFEHDDTVDCCYCYAVRGTGCELESVRVLYFINTSGDNYYSEIKISQHFNPVRHSEDITDYKEITKEEFDVHYNKGIAILNKEINGR